MNIDVSPDGDSAIERLCELIAGAAPRSLVLTGGTTAGAAYDLLASDAWRERIDWSQVTLYWGDERRVPPDDEGSCYRLVAETLLAGVTPAAVERMRGEEPDGDAEADRYGALLPQRFDVTLLSMGEDGHCASLFPGSPQLAERERLCTTGLAPYAPYERITLTLPALDRSRLVLILALGERKRDALARIRAGERLPSALVAPGEGEVVWIADRAAAGE
ncbi:MAG: 6-phosphogluconolactonase [Gaiellales bacterium]|nr:6-phosphogluconolactonase [Gaiellales bacterium]